MLWTILCILVVWGIYVYFFDRKDSQAEYDDDVKINQTPLPESWLVKGSKSLKHDPTFKIRSW